MADMFVLTEQERVTTASRYRDGVLICRPFGVVRWENAGLVVFALFVSGSLLASVRRDPDPASITLAVVFASTLVGASVVWAVAFARSHVRADADGLMIRDRLRTHRFTWDQIEGFDVIEQKSPVRWWPNLTAGFTWHIWPNEAIPVMRLTDRTQRRLLPLASTQRSNGWSMGDETPAETRAALLTRFQGTLH